MQIRDIDMIGDYVIERRQMREDKVEIFRFASLDIFMTGGYNAAKHAGVEKFM